MDILKNSAGKLGITLTETQLGRFEEYYRALLDWNKRVNLTSVTGYEDVQITHFLDSLSVILALREYPADKLLRVIDVGSGAGFPGIPLRIVIPDIHLVLLEATAKKAGFLEYVVDKLELDDVRVLNGRAEDLAREADYREIFDIVLSRAVAPLATLAELTLPFCDVGGCLVALKKGDIDKEIITAGPAITLLGGQLKEIVKVSGDLFDDDRCLVVVSKVRETPPKYPRRPGVPGKRPLS